MQAESLADEELLLACREADEDTVRRYLCIVFRRHERALLSYLFRMLGDRGRAEDLVQETFLRVYRASRGYKPVARFSTWLYRIATNVARNEIRDRRLRPHLVLDRPLGGGDEASMVELLSGSEEAPDAKAERNEVAGKVQEALLQVKEPFRSVLVLCDLQELTYAEAAEALGVRVGTIRSRLHRARGRLAKVLEGDRGRLP